MDANNVKKQKKKGILRTEAVVPVLVILVLMFLYFRFMFDRQLKAAIEWGGSYIYGAEINVANVQTSFLDLYFVMNGLQVTDKSQPERNLVSIEKIRFDLLGDALLRAKGVVEDASIINVQAYSPRKRPGYVKPPEPPSKKSPSIIDDIEARAEARLKKQYEKNVLGDLANLATGTDPKDQLKNIQAQLKSEQKIKELERFIKEKEKEWKTRIEKFPKKDEINVLVNRSKELKFNTKNPVQFAKDLKEADKIYREMNDILKNVKETSNGLKTDVSSADQGIKDIEKFVKEDVEDLKKRLKIPSFDSKSFTQAIFMSMLNDKLKSAEKFVAVSREYMPTKKKDVQEQLVPRQRSQGRNVHYPITRGYPLFWLKKAELTSEANVSEYSGNIAGKITDITTSPKVIGRPAVIDLKGNFPKQKIEGFAANIKIDHTTDTPKESFNISVASYPFGGLKIADDSNLKLSLNPVPASVSMGGVFANEKLSLAVQNTFKKDQTGSSFSVESKQKFLQDLLQKTFASLPEVVVNASFEGTFLDFDMHVNSNLGAALEDGIKREVSSKIADQQKLIEDFVQNKIKGDKDKLSSEFSKVKDKVNTEILGKEKELNSEVDQAKNDISKQKSGGSGGGSGGKPSLKNLKDLKKSFGF